MSYLVTGADEGANEEGIVKGAASFSWFWSSIVIDCDEGYDKEGLSEQERHYFHHVWQTSTTFDGRKNKKRFYVIKIPRCTSVQHLIIFQDHTIQSRSRSVVKSDGPVGD